MPMYNLIEYSDNYSKTSGKRQICEGDSPKWRSKIILEMELSNTRGIANNSILM